MGTHNFHIKTFRSFDSSVIDFSKRILDKDDNIMIISPGKTDPYSRNHNSNSISIHEIHDINNNAINLRDFTESIKIELTPNFVNKKTFDTSILKILNANEDPYDTIAVSINATCPKLNYVIDSRTIPLKDIENMTSILIGPILLNDIVGKIEIESELIRIKNSNQGAYEIANSRYTILAINKTISVFIDEVEEIGGNSLVIEPANLGEKLFAFKNINPLGIELPTLEYNEELKSYFSNGDKYKTVQAILMIIGYPYMENLLKWIIFGRPDFKKDSHLSVIKFISEICEKHEDEIEELNIESDLEIKLKGYFLLSNKLFENIQEISKTWKGIASNLITNEKL